MSQVRCTGHRHGQAVWVTLGHRESLRGYFMLVEAQDAMGRRRELYSSWFRRGLASFQTALVRLGVRAPRPLFRQVAERGAQHQALHGLKMARTAPPQ